MPPPLRAVSLFSNCGAGDVGFREAGFRFAVLAEIDPRRLVVAGLNHPGATTVVGDLRNTWERVVEAYQGATADAPLDLLAACPPCQGMSSANADRGLEHDADAGSLDARNLLVEPIAAVARALSPKVIVVENVPAFLSRKVRHPDDGRPVSAAALLTERLAERYAVYPVAVDLAEFGVPQTRKRAFLTFVRRDLPACGALARAGRAPYPAPTHIGREVTLETALAAMNLPPLDAASAESARDPDRPLHCVPVWASPYRGGGAARYAMVRTIPPGGGGSAWDNTTCLGCNVRAEDPEAAVCAACEAPLPRPVVRDPKTGAWRLVRGFRSSSYRRMRPDQPAATVTTASGHVGSDFTIHPTEHRLLSPLECQILQTLPADFQWGTALEDGGPTFVREMIGEAVPPHFTRQHGEVLAALVRLAPEKDVPGAGSAAPANVQLDASGLLGEACALAAVVRAEVPAPLGDASSEPQALVGAGAWPAMLRAADPRCVRAHARLARRTRDSDPAPADAAPVLALQAGS